MTLAFDLFWSFRSPYSYLLTPRLVALERDFDVSCNVRIVYPIAVRQADFFAHADPLWAPYLVRDTYRTAQFLAVPFRWPRPDPVLMDLATRTYAADQPHIHRLSHLGVAAAERGHGLGFIAQVSALIWDGATDDWHLGNHLAQAAARSGCDLDELDAAIAADEAHFKAVIETNQVDQRKGGHYGVPLMVMGGEPFFGQDRFDQLRWRLEQAGLARR